MNTFQLEPKYPVKRPNAIEKQQDMKNTENKVKRKKYVKKRVGGRGKVIKNFSFLGSVS